MGQFYIERYIYTDIYNTLEREREREREKERERKRGRERERDWWESVTLIGQFHIESIYIQMACVTLSNQCLIYISKEEIERERERERDWQESVTTLRR